MSGMVERVAWLICKMECGRHCAAVEECRPSIEYIYCARDVIEAMREPTEAMHAHMNSGQRKLALCYWPQMIDAALVDAPDTVEPPSDTEAP